VKEAEITDNKKKIGIAPEAIAAKTKSIQAKQIEV
jgi:hypothetical protein